MKKNDLQELIFKAKSKLLDNNWGDNYNLENEFAIDDYIDVLLDLVEESFDES
jgi:hypothetical protein